MNSSTSISKRWLIIYAVTLLAAIALGWAYAVWFEPETKFWRKAFIERRAQFEEPLEERRVIFTGDSACAFGINPSVFKEETGLLSANLGGTRQMGIRVFMDEALSQTREGDAIVLICNPYLLVAEASHGSHPNAGARMALALSADLTAREFVDATRPGFNHLVSLGGKIALGMPMFRSLGEIARLLR